jgi:hypothetical protein
MQLVLGYEAQSCSISLLPGSQHFNKSYLVCLSSVDTSIMPLVLSCCCSSLLLLLGTVCTKVALLVYYEWMILPATAVLAAAAADAVAALIT